MPMSAFGRAALLSALATLAGAGGILAQGSAAFDGAELEVVSEWTGQDRGDGSETVHASLRQRKSRVGNLKLPPIPNTRIRRPPLPAEVVSRLQCTRTVPVMPP